MKRAELSVGRHVWVGGRTGEEGWVLDAEANWDEYRWSTGTRDRFTKGDGNRVAVAIRNRGIRGEAPTWRPATVVLGQVQDFEEREQEQRRIRQDAAAQRQREQDAYQARVDRENQLNERLRAVLGGSTTKWASVSREGVRVSESAFEGLLSAAERKT